jgi:nicotinate phosphoribosyltransferase
MSGKSKTESSKTESPKSDPKDAEEKERLERKLEEGLKGTFPASDPVAVSEPAAPEPSSKKR